MKNQKLHQLQTEWSNKLPQLFQVDNLYFKIVYPLTYNGNSTNIVEETLKQISGLKEVHEYMSNMNTPDLRMSNYFNFSLPASLCAALENDCPLAYSLLSGEIIKLLKPRQELPNQEEIEFIETILAKSIRLFGALGHFFSLRINLELGHCCKRKKVEGNTSFFQSGQNEAQKYYQNALEAYNLFDANKEAHKDFFINAYLGMSIDEIIKLQLKCENSEALRLFLKQLNRHVDRVIVSDNAPRLM